MKKRIDAVIMLIILLASVPAVLLGAEEIRISQVDTNALLFRGEIDIYFSVSGGEDEALVPENLSVFEERAGALDVLALDRDPNREAGIDFLLLIDNSGSMYEESYQGSSRIVQAKLALASFLEQVDEEKDRISVYAFNTELKELAHFGTTVPDIHRGLSGLEEPEAGMSYTELYNALAESGKIFPREAGRRAVIVLSDGENYSLYERGGVEHEVWGPTVPLPEEIIEAFHKSGVTLDGINLSNEMDANLADICEASGGKFHDVRTTAAISSVYQEVREKITNEYRVTVKAPPGTGTLGRLELKYGEASDSRSLLLPMIFGGASDFSILLPILLLILGLGGGGLLFYLPFEKPVQSPQIQALDSHQTIQLNEGGDTVIGASREADYTLAGNPGIDHEHATIVHDEKKGTFTLRTKRAVRVNNRKTKKRDLTPGDVIQIEGATIIFDAPVKTTGTELNGK